MMRMLSISLGFYLLGLLSVGAFVRRGFCPTLVKINDIFYIINYILVKPDKPSIVSAHFNKNCLNVSWSKIESGNCCVFYTVQYDESTLITGTKLLKYVICNFNASANDNVSVRAEVGGRIGDFKDVKIIFITPPPPTAKTTTATTLSSSTAQSHKGSLL